MRLYYEIAVRSLRRATIYRSALIAGMLTNAFFGAMRCFVLAAVYGSSASVAGFTLSQAISYTWITQSLISVGGGWVTTEMMQTIRSGDVITDLARPWNFYGYWLSRTTGERIFNLLVRGLLTYLAGVVLFHIHIPSAAELACFGAAIALAMLVSFAYSFIINATAFWLIDSYGPMMIGTMLLTFFSGFVLPISFFPPALQRLAHVLPFQAITGMPAQILLGQIRGADFVGVLLLQVFWAAVMTIAALAMLRAATRKLVVQGG